MAFAYNIVLVDKTRCGVNVKALTVWFSKVTWVRLMNLQWVSWKTWARFQFTNCCKIAEAQKIIKIDCENISGLRKISKQTIGTKKINPKENRHKTPRIYMVQQ